MRFAGNKQRGRFRGLLFSALLMLVFLLLFTFGTDWFSQSSAQKQKEQLVSALNSAAVYAYASEGAYPGSLDSIKEEYGITYDEDRFNVEYRVLGANLFPEINVYEKENGSYEQ